MKVSWGCSATFSETQTGWGRLYLCIVMVVETGLPRLYFQNCQDMGICPMDLKSFYLKAMLLLNHPKQGKQPQLISRGWGCRFLPHPREGKGPGIM